MSNLSSIDEYQLRVCVEELRFVVKHRPDIVRLENRPDIIKILNSPIGLSIIKHAQQAIWTARRIASKLSFPGLGQFKRFPHNDGSHEPTSVWIDCHAVSRRPRLLLDVTHTRRSGVGGGIARVARELANAAAETGLALPVFIQDGQLKPYYAFEGMPERIELSSDDSYVILDTFWDPFSEYEAICDLAHRRGARIATCIHDIIPLRYPAFVDPDFAVSFRALFPRMIAMSDTCLAVSKTAIDEIRQYVEANAMSHREALSFSWFHLGADIHAPYPAAHLNNRAGLFGDGTPVFLSVGTVEPKKGYPIALDAFEKLWLEGCDAKYLIMGRYGWNAGALKDRLLNHPEFGRRLNWVQDAGDGDLQFAYRNSYCAIQPSVAEGFGLPLIEAAHHKLPIIARSIDVFHEIAGDAVTYFDVCDSFMLASRIRDAIARKPPPSAIECLTWHQSLRALHRALYPTHNLEGAVGDTRARCLHQRAPSA